MIYDDTEVEDTQNEDIDAMEEEGNDEDEDFILFEWGGRKPGGRECGSRPTDGC
jgi:hypothetical protein